MERRGETPTGFARKSKTLQEHSDTAKKQGCFVSIVTLKTANLKEYGKTFIMLAFLYAKIENITRKDGRVFIKAIY